MPRDRDELARRFPRAVPSYDLGFRSFVFVPLIARGKAIGMIAFLSTESKAYVERHLNLAERVGVLMSGTLRERAALLRAQADRRRPAGEPGAAPSPPRRNSRYAVRGQERWHLRRLCAWK